jgi:S1-C subfamily serine protease
MTSRRFVAVLSCVVWFLTGPGVLAQVKPTIADIARQQSPCVVWITEYDQAGKPFAFGSGFIVRADGIVVTNHHVIDGAFTVSVSVSTGDIFDDPVVLDSDVRRDLAVLKVKALKLPTCRIGDSDSVEIGQHVIAIGNPKGLSQTVSDGIVSAVRQSTGYRMLQLTAPISHGSSGGPLLNDRGEVIGVTTAGYEEGQNLNFAVPINYVKPMFTSLEMARARTLREYNAGHMVTAKTSKPPASGTAAPTQTAETTAATSAPGGGDAAREELQKKGLAAFLKPSLGSWNEDQAKGVLGDPIRHRFSYDKFKTMDGDMYAYTDPTKFVQYVELAFDIKTKKVRSFSLNRPLKPLTWKELSKVWGDKFTSRTSADGSKLYRYEDRRIDVIVDKNEMVQLIGFY